MKETSSAHQLLSTIPKVKCAGSRLMLWGCFSAEGTKGLVRIEEKLNAQNIESLNESLVQRIQNLRLGRMFNFQKDNDPKHTARVAYRQPLSGPATAWDWTQSNIALETWKCASAPIQTDRAWEVKRQGEEWQIISNDDDQSLSHHTQKYLRL